MKTYIRYVNDGLLNIPELLFSFSLFFINRFETFEKMKAWMLDIKNEAQNMTFTDEDQLDWWNALFAEVQTIEPKNAPRRDGLTGDADHGKSNYFLLFYRIEIIL